MKDMLDRMNSVGVFPTYIILNKIATVFFDENNKKIYIPILKDHNVIDIVDITKYEIITETDDNLQFTVGTYFTGKIKHNTKINNILVRIYLNTIDTPYVEIPCMRFSYNIVDEKNADDFAHQIVGVLDYLKNNELKEKKPIIDISNLNNPNQIKIM